MHKTLYIESDSLKSLDSSSKGLRICGYANTVEKDRTGDVIIPSAWVHGIANYRKNPVLLNQHDKNQPIGKVEKVIVDKKGIYVEAYVSEAAEKLYGTQTLINDGVLKSFSVGFRLKNKKYDKRDDTTFITDLELLEISVVSIPANQNSLFSIRKNFDSEEEYNKFMKSFDAKNSTETSEEEVSGNLKAGISSKNKDHYHTFEIDEDGNGVSTYTSHGQKHKHKVKNFSIQDVEDHSHEVSQWVDTEKFLLLDDTEKTDQQGDILMPEAHEENAEVSEEEITEIQMVAEEPEKDINTDVDTKTNKKPDNKPSNEIEDSDKDKKSRNNSPYSDVRESPDKEIPFTNLLSFETSQLEKGTFVTLDNKRYVIEEIATAKNPHFKFTEVDINGKKTDSELEVYAETLSVLNTWDLNTKFDIHLAHHDKDYEFNDELRTQIKENFNSCVNMSEAELYSMKDTQEVIDNIYHQDKLNKVMNLLATNKAHWTDTNYIVADRICKEIKAIEKQIPENEKYRELMLNLYGHKDKKETENMPTNNEAIAHAGDPVVVDTKNSTQAAEEENQETSSRATVSEPRVAELVEETGKAILASAETDEEDYSGTRADADRIDELMAQNRKYQDQISAMINSKMLWNEDQKTSIQFTNKEMANALLLGKALQKSDPFDTKLGRRMKAVTTVDAFLSNFSTTVYDEMQQQLVIAPMLNRMPVDARTFRVPVANEDTDGDVAQFASGTFATGAYDTTRVPTSNQHSFTAVEFTPHKFMATTHLAKDEEEDTIIPLVDFLRAGAARRIARAIDKALLRGDGTLSGFTASPTNAITAGAGYASVFKGIATLANDIAGLQVNSGASTAATPANIASARAKLGKYGLQLGDHLVYLTTIEGYNSLVQTSDFRTVDKFGPNATYLTGSLGAVYGIPVVITEFLDNAGASTDIVGLLVYKPGFLVAERRGMEIETEYNPRQQVTAIYMSTRFDMKPLSTETNAALSATYSYASVIRSV